MSATSPLFAVKVTLQHRPSLSHPSSTAPALQEVQLLHEEHHAHAFLRLLSAVTAPLLGSPWHHAGDSMLLLWG